MVISEVRFIYPFRLTECEHVRFCLKVIILIPMTTAIYINRMKITNTEHLPK